jgi:hypothetical protein
MIDSTATSKYDYQYKDKTYTTYNPHLMRRYVATSKTSGTVKLRIAPIEIPEPKSELETFYG